MGNSHIFHLLQWKLFLVTILYLQLAFTMPVPFFFFWLLVMEAVAFSCNSCGELRVKEQWEPGQLGIPHDPGICV